MATVDGILIEAWRRGLRVGNPDRFLHAAEPACKRVVLAIVTLVAATVMESCQPEALEGIKFAWFDRFDVGLSHGEEPINIGMIIACSSQVRQILGDRRGARASWAPNIYGVRTKNGEGVLVQRPNISARDVVKEPVPA